MDILDTFTFSNKIKEYKFSFSLIPDVLKYFEIQSNDVHRQQKKNVNRYLYIKQIYNQGFYKYWNEVKYGNYDYFENNHKMYLFEFKTSQDIIDWILK